MAGPGALTARDLTKRPSLDAMDVSGSDDVVVRSRACERRLRKKRHEARLRLQLAADAALLAGHHASAPPSVPGTVSPAELAALRAEVASLRAMVEALRVLLPAAPPPPGVGTAAGGDPSGDPPAVVAASATLAAAAPGTAAGGAPSGDPPAVVAEPAACAAASSLGVASCSAVPDPAPAPAGPGQRDPVAATHVPPLPQRPTEDETVLEALARLADAGADPEEALLAGLRLPLDQAERALLPRIESRSASRQWCAWLAHGLATEARRIIQPRGH